MYHGPDSHFTEQILCHKLLLPISTVQVWTMENPKNRQSQTLQLNTRLYTGTSEFAQQWSQIIAQAQLPDVILWSLHQYGL